jgi:hypothetical protein
MIHIIPKNHKKRKWFAILTYTLLAGLITIWGIYGIGEYGIALFILTPLYIGISLLYYMVLKMGLPRKLLHNIVLLVLAFYYFVYFFLLLKG